MAAELIGENHFRERAWTRVNEQRMRIVGLEAALADAHSELGRLTELALSMTGIHQVDLEELIG